MKASVEKLDENTFALTVYRYGRPVSFYLLCGKERALLIDTGTGDPSLPKQIHSLTALPVIAANTHGHPDNISGNHLFPEIFFPREDAGLAGDEASSGDLRPGSGRFYGVLALVSQPLRDMTSGIRSFDSHDLGETECFDLGGRIIKVLKTPSHTGGSRCFLDEKGGLYCGDLLSGKEADVSLPCSVSLTRYAAILQEIQGLVKSGEVRTLYPTHGSFGLSADLIARVSVIVRHVLNEEIPPERRKSGILKADGFTLRFDPDRI